MDLSKLLGDLYETEESTGDEPPTGSAPAAPSTRPAGPEWADEARLDEAFASWQPGPPDDAPAAERDMANGYFSTPFPQLEAALSSDAQALDPEPAMAGSVDEVGAFEPDGADMETGEALVVTPRMWTRADDDVLPSRRGGRRGGRRGLRLSLRRR